MLPPELGMMPKLLWMGGPQSWIMDGEDLPLSTCFFLTKKKAKILPIHPPEMPKSGLYEKPRGACCFTRKHMGKKKVFRLWMEISAPACWPKPSKSTDHMFPVGICKHAFLLVFNPFVLHLVPASPACHLTSWSGAPTKLGCCEPWWFYHQLASTHTQSINDSHLTQGTCLLGVELRGNTYFHHLAQLRLQAVGLHSSYDAPPQKKKLLTKSHELFEEPIDQNHFSYFILLNLHAC